jgi:uncharacterized RDD family membrane protein YckC
MGQVDTILTVETPEGIDLVLRPAGPVARALAWVVDQLVIWGGLGVAFIVLGFLGAMGVALALLLLFVAQWFYPVIMEVLFHGQTLGKRQVGLRVLMADGRPIGWTPSLIRNLLRVVDALPGPYCIGLLSLLLTSRFQRLGDLVAGTLVVYSEQGRPAGALPPGEAIPVPQGLALEEQQALTAFAERSVRLTPARAEELADILEPLTGGRGEAGLRTLLGMARYLRGGS